MKEIIEKVADELNELAYFYAKTHQHRSGCCNAMAGLLRRWAEELVDE